MKIPVTAWFYDKPMDIKGLSRKFPDKFFEPGEYLLFEFENGRYINIFSFGCVVFWPFDEQISKRFEKDILPQLAKGKRIKKVEDQLQVETDKGLAKVSFDSVCLAGDARRDDVLVITQLLARSVALEYLELHVDDALERFRPSIEELRDKGKVAMSTRSIIKSIGFAMDTRQAVLGRLALLDKPEATWEEDPILEAI